MKIIDIVPCENPQYIKPQKLIFEKDGVRRDWEVADVHDSVSILLYHKQRESFVLVRQFRPAVYLKNNDGYTVELCAGLVDKDKSLEQIAKEEVLEECGYDISIDKIVRITSFYTAVGFAGGKQTLFFAELSDEEKVSDGGGIDDEDIEVLYLPISKSQDFMYDENIAKTPGLLYAFSWFFDINN
jgi:UDP-sugar diphosphatase